MKPKVILKSLADLSPEVVDGESPRPPQARPEPTPIGEAQPQRTVPLSWTPEYPGLRGYEHWGLNE